MQASATKEKRASEREGAARILRTAVVGVGYLGRFHAEKLAEIGEADLVAVVDIDADARETVARRLGVEGLVDYRGLLGEVDAVSIVVPTPLHFEIARAFLEAGVHVLVEKPITETPEQATTLIEAAAARGLVLQIGHLERFNSAMRTLLPMVDTPRFVESVRIAPYKERGTEVDVILDLMIHDIDLIQHIVRSPVAHIDAIGASVITHKPDIANARLRFENGCVANVTASRTSMKTERKIRIFQEDSYISADLQQKMLAIHRKGTAHDGGGRVAIFTEEIKCDDDDALRLEIEAFLDAARNGTRPLVTGEDGRQALRTAMDIVAQVEQGR